MGNVNATDPDYWNIPDTPGERNPDWMRELPGSRCVSRLSIPGTHNSLARLGVLHAWCQSLSLNDQLNLGIRFFDIRVRSYNGGLFIHHEQFYQNTSFRDCLNEMTYFLSHHEGEILFMRVKEEYSSTGPNFGLEIERAIGEYSRNFFWNEKMENRSQIKIPTVGEARGKIVILQNFDFGRYIGIDYNDLVISDKYWLNPDDEKWGTVRHNLEKARYPNGKIHFTSNSCSNINCARENARRMNPRLHSYINTNPSPFGIIAIDYPGPKLVSDIIRNN